MPENPSPPAAGATTETTPAATPPDSAAGASGFPPGAVLAERYRIVSLLGRGGMGEVYRAEDLKLGQTVALKFLPPPVARDAAARQRLYQEVRLGRQVSHPNVCRLFDVGEWQGQIFVTMEYIDGEDLASLVRRIGALPPPKVLQLAREIAAGLAAAHGLGVLHRDLKPANIMIDGRGSARITDFGLAVLDEESSEAGGLAGTPLYMAPEQLRGEPATARSDLYALGLVFYEMLTGSRLFDAGTTDELLRQHETSKLGDLSSSAGRSEPALQRVVTRCLEERPEERPASIHAVIAALPGGDPLQAALDAGETPSPELVAAAEGTGELPPAAALGTFALLVVLLLAHALFAERWGQVPGFIEVPERPEALATRAGDLLREVGVPVGEGDRVYRWAFDWDRRHWMAEHGYDWRGRGRRMAPSPAYLWYRYGPEDLEPFGVRQRVSPWDPPFDQPGMARVALDAEGRLLELVVRPPERSSSDGSEGGEELGSDSGVDWDRLLQATGLDPARLEEVEPEWMPPVGSTRRRAWTGSYPAQPGLGVRAEAATANDRLVWLRVIPPWVAAEQEAPPSQGVSGRLWAATTVLAGLLGLILLGAAALLARRNLRRGRGDRRGALRLGLVLGVAAVAQQVARADFAPSGILRQLYLLLGLAIAYGFAAWIVYLAIEPYLRRSWPRLMVGLHRLLAGRLRDPRVGREVLLGLTAGGLLVVALWVLAVAMRIPEIAYSPPLEMLGRFRDLAGGLFSALLEAGNAALFFGLVLLVGILLLRRRRLAVGALWLVLFLLLGEGIFDLGYALVYRLVVATLVTIVLVRVGLLAVAAMSFAYSVLESFPFTLDPGAWYFVHSLVPLLLLLAFGGWATWRALGSQPAVASWLEEEPVVR